MTRLIALVATLAAAGLVADVAAAQTAGDWAQFRGPSGSGVADDQKPPIEFGPDKNVKWKTSVPAGMSSPIVIGDLIVLTAFENHKLFTIAYRRTDGMEAWRAESPAKEIERFHKTEGSPAASTCVTDGKHIVSYFARVASFVTMRRGSSSGNTNCRRR